MTRRLAPWPDAAGNPIREGDWIEHPDGERAQVVYCLDPKYNAPHRGDSDRWRAIYSDGVSLWLGNQIGTKGQAIVCKVMKHKVSELEGALLDAAVAKALGAAVRIAEGPMGDAMCFARGSTSGPKHGPTWKAEVPFCPSTDWGDGGPILYGERIGFAQAFDHATGLLPDEWVALPAGECGLRGAVGPTPLIATFRYFVASKFGAEVELP